MINCWSFKTFVYRADYGASWILSFAGNQDRHTISYELKFQLDALNELQLPLGANNIPIELLLEKWCKHNLCSTLIFTGQVTRTGITSRL